jgi:ferric-chelate reductase (NADPH)
MWNEILGNVLKMPLAEVVQVADVAPSFRRVRLRAQAMKRFDWSPGDKIQVLISGMTARTYTPLYLDTETGETEFLAYIRPGTEDSAVRPWLSALSAGAQVRVFGPR